MLTYVKDYKRIPVSLTNAFEEVGEGQVSAAKGAYMYISERFQVAASLRLELSSESRPSNQVESDIYIRNTYKTADIHVMSDDFRYSKHSY